MSDDEPSKPERIDLSKGFEVREVPTFSLEWAAVVKPVTWALIALLTMIIAAPFGFGLFVKYDKELFSSIFDWAKTVLPVLSGFIAASVAYFFGAQNRTIPPKADD